MGAVFADIELIGGESEGVGKFYKAVTQAVLLFGASEIFMTEYAMEEYANPCIFV